MERYFCYISDTHINFVKQQVIRFPALHKTGIIHSRLHSLKDVTDHLYMFICMCILLESVHISKLQISSLGKTSKIFIMRVCICICFIVPNVFILTATHAYIGKRNNRKCQKW